MTFLKMIKTGGNSRRIILSILAISLIIPTVASFQPLYVLTIVVMIAGLMLLLHRPVFGLVALVVAGLVVPFSVDTGTQTRLNLAFLLVPGLSVIWVLKMFLEGNVRFKVSGPALPLLLFCCSSALSFLLGIFPWRLDAETAPLHAQGAGFTLVLFSCLVFFLASHQIKMQADLEMITWIFVIIGGIHVVGFYLPLIGQYTWNLFDAGSLFWIWIVAIGLGQSLFNRRLRPFYRSLLALIALLAICRGILMTREWASGWVPSLIAAVSILAIRFPRTAALIFLLSLFAFVPMIPWASDFVMVGDQSYSLMTRIEAARISSEIIRSSFLFGTGPANYYFYTPFYPILGWHVHFSFHNNFLDLAAQYGLLGLLLMIWFLIASGILCFRLIKQLEDGFNRAFTIAVLGGLVGTVMAGLLGDWIIPFVYNVGIPGFRTSLLGWVFLGCLSSFKTFYQIDDPVNQP